MSWIIEAVNGWVRFNTYHPEINKIGLWIEITEDRATYELWKKGDYYELQRPKIDQFIEAARRSLSVWFR